MTDYDLEYIKKQLYKFVVRYVLIEYPVKKNKFSSKKKNKTSDSITAAIAGVTAAVNSHFFFR